MKCVFERIGKSPEEIEAKLAKAYSMLFEGDAQSERVCFEYGGDLAYIVDIGHMDVRSEGMSYGMTIAALLHKRYLFDRLWNFAKRYMRNNSGDMEGYYSWQVSVQNFKMIDPGAAPDGEEYFAAALLYGAKIFDCDEYRDEAIKLMNDMAHKPETGDVFTMMDAKAGLVRFSPMRGNDFTDPSYHTLSFYRMYGAAADGDFWKKIAGNSLEYLKKACHPVTGLAADYSEFDGTPKKTPWCDASHCFSGDAWRVAWNIALDAANLDRGAMDCDLEQDEVRKIREWEVSEVRRVLGFFNDHRPYLADMAIDGSAYPREVRTMTGGLIGMNGAATIALAEGDPLIRPFAEDLWNMPVPTGTWRYYDGLLYMLGLLACSGKFFV